MNVIPLGVGSANTKKYYHINLFIDTLDHGLLSMQALQWGDYDHVGGHSELLTRFYWRFTNGQHLPKLVIRFCLLGYIPSAWKERIPSFGIRSSFIIILTPTKRQLHNVWSVCGNTRDTGGFYPCTINKDLSENKL